MSYTCDHKILEKAFSLEDEKQSINGTGIGYRTFAFSSAHAGHLPGLSYLPATEKNLLARIPDTEIMENINFRYPVFFPEGMNSANKAIILLHGLNEKSWAKYLTWARKLVLATGSPVILFPISFHMNRSPEEWIDRRSMAALSRIRQSRYKESGSSSFANAALSERLDKLPERFALSGYQSVMDLLSLVKNIKNGSHPAFERDTGIDFFGYSIGAFLSQVLMIANPGCVFNHSKFMLFAGGTVFSQINGISRFIMDRQAFGQLRKFYLNEQEWRNKLLKSYVEVMDIKHIARAFMAMLSPDHFSPLRERVFSEFKSRLKVVALNEDLVFPAKYIEETFHDSGVSVSRLDLPYKYTHEAPFPLNSDLQISALVDQWFDKIFAEAGDFFSLSETEL